MGITRKLQQLLCQHAPSHLLILVNIQAGPVTIQSVSFINEMISRSIVNKPVLYTFKTVSYKIPCYIPCSQLRPYPRSKRLQSVLYYYCFVSCFSLAASGSQDRTESEKRERNKQIFFLSCCCCNLAFGVLWKLVLGISLVRHFNVPRSCALQCLN